MCRVRCKPAFQLQLLWYIKTNTLFHYGLISKCDIHYKICSRRSTRYISFLFACLLGCFVHFLRLKTSNGHRLDYVFSRFGQHTIQTYQAASLVWYTHIGFGSWDMWNCSAADRLFEAIEQVLLHCFAQVEAAESLWKRCCQPQADNLEASKAKNCSAIRTVWLSDSQHEKFGEGQKALVIVLGAQCVESSV